MKSYLDEANKCKDQANHNWKVAINSATGYDCLKDEYHEVCAAAVERVKDASQLVFDAKDIAYFENLGIDQEEAITDLLTRINQFRCKHEHTSTYLMGQAPDNFWEEEHCLDCHRTLIDAGGFMAVVR